MNKTISINIGATNFFIEESAYARLDAYLTSIRGHFASQEGHDEIISDIEDRIAEKFTAALGENLRGTITLEDVQSVITELGTPDAIASQDDAPASGTEEPATAPSPRRLMRDPDNALIGGVAAGLAAYFDIDVVAARLVFVLLLAAWGFALPLYFILWLIMPEARTQADKMEMHGKPFTLSSLSQAIEERAQDVKRSSNNARSAAVSVFRGLGRIIRTLVALAAKIGGAGIAALSTLGIAGLTFVAAVLMFNAGSPSLQFPFQTLAQDEIYYIIVALVYLFFIIPGIFTLLAGLTLLGKKTVFFGARTAVGLIGLWMLAGIAAGVLAIDRVPGYVAQLQETPELKELQEARDIGKFSKLVLNGDARYVIRQGDTYSLALMGTRSALDEITVNEQDDTLSIAHTRASRGKCFLFCPRITPTIQITAPSFSEIETRNGRLITDTPIAGTDMSFTLDDASAALEIKGGEVTIAASGTRISLLGSVKSLNAKLSSYSRLDASGLEVTKATLRASSQSSALITPLTSLDFSTDQYSSVEYEKSPSLHFSTSSSMLQR